MSVIMQCEDLTKRFGKDTALDGIDLTIESGKIVGLLGPNGSGKTTLIKLTNGILQPTGGSVRICGCIPGKDTKSIISYLPDIDYLPGHLNAEGLFKMFNDFFEDFDIEKAQEMLASLKLSPKDRLGKFSKGNREKVALVLAMSRRAKLYLLDEPMGGADPAARDYILSSIIGNYREEAAVLISTHLIADVERILDEAVFINKGKLIFHRSIDEIRQTEGKSADALFREVFGC